jgi:hypothetical protein
MNDKALNRQAKASRVLLIIVLCSIGFNTGKFYQTQYILTNPLIPAEATLQIAKPYLWVSFVSVIASILALLFYFYAKYLITIIICALILVWQQYYIWLG